MCRIALITCLTCETNFNLAQFDRWFLTRIQETVRV
jgi:hypothetical protein